MATDFEGAMGHALSALKARLMDTATLTYAADSTTATVSVAFVEQVGFVDDFLRAVFTFAAADITTDIARGDHFVLSGQTQRWYVVDVRDDKSGGIEVRADANIERT